MSNIKCIIIEDEPLAAKVLKDYIGQLSYLELVGIFKDAILASEYLRMHAVDLIFLDIHLPRLKGMDFLKTLHQPPAVIVTTAYHQYAVDGYELNITDYLLKPFGFERFLKAIHKVKLIHEPPPTPPEKDFIFVNVQKKKVKILFADILYIESQREYVRIVTLKKEYVSKMSTHEIGAMLPPAQFQRIHRSFVVAVPKIDSYTAEMVEINGVTIPVGRDYRNVLADL